ncbi:MAG: DUF2326 domain-containing protein [Steroidobacteraceae bacterium]
MIKRLSANRSSFKTVEFGPGFNVIWADRTRESTKRDSRNGLGKSTLIEVIHFCLGAKASKGKGLLVGALSGWEFTLSIEVDGKSLSVTRRIDKPNLFFIDGDLEQLKIRPRREKSGELAYGIKEWTSLLGNLFYGLPIDRESKYGPSFRSLISYSIRRGKDAYSSPFEHFRKQAEWDKQVNNAFLLGLAWADGSEMQLLRDRKKGLDALKRAARAGVVTAFSGSLGDLEARRVRLQNKADSDARDLAAFQVHPQYKELRIQADELTESIHELANLNSLDQRMLSLYEKALSDEEVPVPNLIEKMYADVGIALPGVAMRRMEDVQEFHYKIVRNRRDFLAAEVSRLRREVADRDGRIRELSDERAGAMIILQTHGALEEHTVLQQRHLETLSERNSISSSIENLKSCATGLSELKIDQEVLYQRARRDYDERREIWERAIELFNGFTERLYSVAGRLVIEFGATGFKFDVEIERSGSAGVGNMKIFCYDMTIAALWADKYPSPRVVIHDSAIFDGVDERQRALALELAASECESRNYQYICTLNSDEVPWEEFSQGFNLREYVISTLTDSGEDGSLLGLRF